MGEGQRSAAGAPSAAAQRSRRHRLLGRGLGGRLGGLLQVGLVHQDLHHLAHGGVRVHVEADVLQGGSRGVGGGGGEASWGGEAHSGGGSLSSAAQCMPSDSATPQLPSTARPLGPAHRCPGPLPETHAPTCAHLNALLGGHGVGGLVDEVGSMQAHEVHAQDLAVARGEGRAGAGTVGQRRPPMGPGAAGFRQTRQARWEEKGGRREEHLIQGKQVRQAGRVQQMAGC